MSSSQPRPNSAPVHRAGATAEPDGDAVVAASDWEVAVPIGDASTFTVLANELVRVASAYADDALIVITDNRTASQTSALETLRTVAATVYLAGPPPYLWPESARLAHIENPAGFSYAQFLVIVSPAISFAVLGAGAAGESPADAAWGYWSADRAYVERAAEALLSGAGHGWDGGIGASASGGSNTTVSAAMYLMGVHTRQNVLRQRDIAMDKDDLLSVLNILKAISAQRRAHDILYIFVEKIAQVIQLDRCSVLRVWGDDKVGHVLASHEDASVSDLVVSLDKYPEITQAMTVNEKIVINDVFHDPLTRKFSKEFTAAQISSLLVIPIGLYDQSVGSLFLRGARTTGPFTLREVSFCEIVAEAASNALERGQLFENIQRANERLARLAVTDGLTGLYNHRFFRERISEEVERARRYRQPLSCMIFDIDNFKRINDTYGHLHGDEILREMANCTLATVRKSDIVARYGGEEFVVIMPQTDLGGARANAERVLNALRKQTYRGFPEDFHVTVSAGVAIFEHETMFEPEALIRLADSALYDAKRGGKNRAVVTAPRGDQV